jgi:carbamoyltransferase
LRVLGISALYNDSAAELIEEGRIIAAAQEERFTRKKHDSRFPVQASIIACPQRNGGLIGG